MILSYLILLLGILYVFLTIPIGLLIYYLYTHIRKDGPTQELQKVILFLSIAKFLFILDEIYTVVLALMNRQTDGLFVVITFTFTVSLLTVANWYAVYKIEKLIA